MNDNAARESLRRTLAQAARRLCVRRFLAELPLAGVAALAGPALAALLPAGPPSRALAVATPLVSAAILAWRTVRPPTPAQTAAWLDRRAGLADTLTTALWFLDRAPDDDWVRHQRERAAETGDALDVRGLVALRVPPGPAAVAAALALVVILAGRPARTTTAPAGAAIPEADAPGTAPRSAGDLEPEADAPQGRDRVGDALPVPGELEELAEELRRGMSDEVRKRLEELARQAQAARPRGAEPGDGEAETAPSRALTGEELAAALSDASRAVDPGEAEAAEQALEEAGESVEGPRDEAAANAEAAPPQQAAAAQDTAAKAPADPGVRWSLDALDPQAMSAEEAQQAARGDAAGPPAGGDPEEGEATELDVELEREALSSESARETEPSEITEESSSEQASRVGYRGGGGGRYESASPQEGARVPWSDRERVRLYLLALTREETQE